MHVITPEPKTESAAVAKSKGPAVVSVLSGKGGVGKTVFSANLAVALAEQIRGVLLIDCDLSAGQAHLVLGLYPPYGLAQVLRGERTLAQILVRAGDGFLLVPGGPSGGSAVELKGKEVRRLAAEARLAVPSAQAILFDVGAGRAAAASDFAAVADVLIVLTTPEPTAIRATIALIEAMLSERPEAEPRLVINMVSNEQEARAAYTKIVGALLPVFSNEPGYLGYVPYDLEISRSLWRYRPVFTYAPRSRAAGAFRVLRSALAAQLGMGMGSSVQSSAEGSESDGAEKARADREIRGSGFCDGSDEPGWDDEDDGGEVRAA